MQVLDGIKVLDVTQFISGSKCTQILADMGADVVRIEPPSGETFRLIVQFMPGAERTYSVLNRNKYGITLDWHRPEGQDIMRRLVSLSDIFIHNLIPGTLDRNHLGYEDLKKVKNDIIYVSISGFGTTGVKPERAAFDILSSCFLYLLENSEMNLLTNSLISSIRSRKGGICKFITFNL